MTFQNGNNDGALVEEGFLRLTILLVFASSYCRYVTLYKPSVTNYYAVVS